MSDFLPISATDGVARSESSRRNVEQGRPAAPASAGRDTADRVELSDRALWLAALRDLPEVRQELVDHARASIASGRYEDPAVLDGTVSRLAGDLDLLA